ncbi:MAG: hypothetical protein WBF42_19115 [Terracidiphilus sp.]
MTFLPRSWVVSILGLLCFVCCPPLYAVRSATNASETIVIPGPLRSFLRMAGVSQQVTRDQVLPEVARNVALLGYQSHRHTEFLILLNRYLHQARELADIAGPDGEIRVADCASSARLIAVLGYRLRGACGQRSVNLVTADPERAFLTIDSGFPLTQFEQALARNAPFNYPYAGTAVPIFFTLHDWDSVFPKERKQGNDLLAMLLDDQDADHLYWALSRCNEETRLALRSSPGLRKLVPVSADFSLYGNGIEVNEGKVVVPGNAVNEWEELVGEQVNAPGDFIIRLLGKDRGWLVAYYDVMAHLAKDQQVHLTADGRLRNLYDAYRSTTPRNDASDGVFPRNAELLILYTSLKWGPDGALPIHEGPDVWTAILGTHPKGEESSHAGHVLDTPEHFLETLVAQANLSGNGNPIQAFCMLEAISAGRPAPERLSAATEQLIARRLPQFSHWFEIFAEFPQLDDASVTHFVSAADRIDGISNPSLRANALGALQATIGLWQIFARQHQIPPGQLNATWQSTVAPFGSVSSPVQVFQASRTSLQSLFAAVAAGAGLPGANSAGKLTITQDQLVDLLAGPAQRSDQGKRVHAELVRRMHAVLDDQRLVSLDTLFGLYDGLGDMAHGAALGDQLLPLAGSLREFEMPRPIFTGGEKVQWSPIVYTSRHAELQIRTDLTRTIKSGTPAQLEAARGQLAPFLRDTLVGLNYAYYEPPGAEVLHNNPLFVRSHDFSSISIQGVQQLWGDPGLIGIGATAGGGAYLMGSLIGLPYALAATEQDFIAPRNVQALIWKEAVPDLIVDAVLPRWWSVTPQELHAVALYQRTGDELLTGSAASPALRARVIAILADCMTPDRLARVEADLRTPDTVGDAIALTAASEEFYLAAEFRKRYPDQAAAIGASGRELDELLRAAPAETATARLAQDFGTPHPQLLSTNSRALANPKPIPAYSGGASRLLAESWESNNLYWARLADEMGYPPVMLNLLVPALTRRMVVNIFASNIDDWPALLRAMHQTGSEFREGKIPLEGTSLVARQ